MRQRRLRYLVGALGALALLLPGCANHVAQTNAPAAVAPAVSGGPLDLRSVCPSTVVVQIDWDPNAENFGALYGLLGPNPLIDAARKRVTAPLVAQGRDTGVKLEIRAGGPAIGFARATAQMYADPSITLAAPSSFDELIELSRTQPAQAVLALVDKDPQIILWDPQRHPEFHSIADIGKTDAKVLYLPGSPFIDYLLGAGLLKRGQLDGGYDGSPARFTAEQGAVASQGYASTDPYMYQTVFKAWGKPIAYQLVYDTGYPNYGATLAMRVADHAKLAACLKKLVPIVQREQVEVINDPGAAIDLTLSLDRADKATTPYSKGLSEFAVGQMRGLGLWGNGTPTDGIIGNFDDARVQRLIDIDKPIFATANKPIRDGLGPSDVTTNEFIDPGIGVK